MAEIRPAPYHDQPGSAGLQHIDSPGPGPGRRRARPSGDDEHAYQADQAEESHGVDWAGRAETRGRGRRALSMADPEIDSRWVDRQDTAETRLIRAVGTIGDGEAVRRRSGSPAPEADAPTATPSGAPKRPRVRFTAAGLCVAGILVTQTTVAVSSYSGFSSAYPASDAVASGHQLLHALWHGGGRPDFTATMTGSPFISPLLMAAADYFGGARLVGLLVAVLTGAATLAAYLAARRLHGPAVGAIAAGVFAVLLILRPGMVNSCFEPLAVCAMAWAGYCVVGFAHDGARNLLPLGAVLMILADYADYSVFWWDLAIVATLLLVRPDHDGWHHSRTWSAQRFVLVAGVLLTVCLLAGRAPYFHAISNAIGQSDGSALALGAWFAALGLARSAVGPDARSPRSVRRSSSTASPSPGS